MGRAHSWTGDWRIALPMAGGAAVLGLGSLYVTGLVTGGDVDPGTRVRGVDIGGMSRAEAQRTLDRELGPLAAAPVSMKIGDRVEQADPASLGLSLDTAATVERAARTGHDPVTVIGRLFTDRERAVEPVTRFDERAARAAVERIGASTRQQVREGSIAFDKGAPKAVTPLPGVALIGDRAVQTLRDSYLKTQAGPVVLPVERTEPRIGAEETGRALRQFAEPAMSGPVTLTVAGKRIPIGPAVLSGHLEMKPDAQGRLVPALDSKGLLADPAVARPVEAVTRAPRDAALRLGADGRVVVGDQGRAGRQVTEAALGRAVMPLLTRAGAARSGEVATVEVQPDLTSAEAQRLGIKEKVSSFTVEFPAAPYRTTNIGRAVELINGSVVLPGKEWSFNRTVGERTPENGFVDGIMINDGQFVKSPGGGVSAVATTMYNAAFFAGVKTVEHGAHSFYIERYPEGREATVAWGSLDLRWVNDTGHALYVRATSTDTSLTITLLGTKKYDEIRATQGPRTNVTPPGKRTGTGPTCEVQTPLEGFDVAVGRVFVQGGKEVRREDFTTHYTPRDEVTCTPEASETPGSPKTPESEKTPGAPQAPASQSPQAPGTRPSAPPVQTPRPSSATPASTVHALR
ncbi:Vancomycin B-type resistance protein VanW [Streptomyces xanthophaeus]|uniref:VanW family protein n=1 Tax=Streptomyces xanthophaeus TaxID=67385 RepID=UPI00233EC2D9|nr:VanW family protein [Streptomyces xanthophaeus]WCD85033.1 Vancomycin B-type resistance protein VanW [Streptomyces xanthophaeus]